MTGHWILRANQLTAELIHRNDDDKRLEVLADFTNPLGQTKSKELRHDQPGSAHRDFAGSPSSFRLDGGKDPRRDAVAEFSRHAADFIEKQRQAYQFKRLTIAAEPKFLGVLRESLKSREKHLEFFWIAKDLSKLSMHELQKYLEKTAAQIA